MTKFLIDEDVNQKAIKTIPVKEKGFDLAYPERAGYKGAPDQSVKEKAIAEGRTLVTCDRDFSKFNYKPEQFPHGVLLLRQHPRQSQKQLGVLLQSFCEFSLKTFPHNPYDFSWKIIEAHIDRVEIQTIDGLVVYHYH